MFQNPVLQPQPSSSMAAAAHFGNVPVAAVSRSTFDLSHSHKTTFDAGYIVPILVDELVPGDTVSCRLSASIMALNPLKRPLRDNLFFETFAFFVPFRICWKNWERFNGAKDNPNDSTVYVTPKIDVSGGWSASAGSVYDYMDIHPGVQGLVINALYLRGHNKTHNQWFRDQNWQNSVPENYDSDGPDSPSDYDLYRRRKKKDYITGALDRPQKGAAVTFPLAGSAPVVFPTGLGAITATTVSTASNPNDPLNYGLHGTASNLLGGTGGGLNPDEAATIPSTGAGPSDAYADMSTVSATTVNAFRVAVQIQAFLELDARSGTRYPERNFAHFGVVSPDARVQRPELIGMGSNQFSLTPIANTAQGSGGEFLGGLASYAACNTGGGHGFTYSATEHGMILMYMNVRADLSYQYQHRKMWTRSTLYDFYDPGFAHLGEQQVNMSEVYAGALNKTAPWGYQERWSEMRYFPSQITGQLRSDFSTPLHVWHMALEHVAEPVLGDAYLQDTPPMDRVLAVSNGPHFVADLWFDYKAARPMPVYSVPGLSSRF